MPLRGEQVREHRRGGARRRTSASWGRSSGDVVAGAQVAEPVGELPVGIEPARQPQRAQRLVEARRSGRAGRRRGPLEEAASKSALWAVKTAPSSALAELGEHVASGGAPQRAAGDAVHPAWARPAAAARQADQRRPLVDHGAVGLDRDQADLEDPVAPRRQPGRLQVDDGEPGQCHAVTLDRGCDSPDQRPRCRAGTRSGTNRARPSYSSSAARLATSLRSQAVRVMWPKHAGR